VPYGGVGHRLAGPCARLATWLHVPGKEGDRQGAPLSQQSDWAPRRTGRFAYLHGLGAAGRRVRVDALFHPTTHRPPHLLWCGFRHALSWGSPGFRATCARVLLLGAGRQALE
jgi:hypothetical protein